MAIVLRDKRFRSCRRCPHCLAFVDPDAWLQAIDGRTYARHVKSDGRVSIDGTDYYVKRALAGQRLLFRVNAAERCLEVFQQEALIKALPIKGLQGKPMPMEDYIALMQERARSEERQRLFKLHQRRLQTR